MYLIRKLNSNRPFPSSPGPLYQNEVKCSAFDMEMIFYSHANKTHFHKKSCALGLTLKVRVFETRKWPVVLNSTNSDITFLLCFVLAGRANTVQPSNVFELPASPADRVSS